MARIFTRRDRDHEAPAQTRLPEGEVHTEMVRRIEAYTVPPFAPGDDERERFLRLDKPPVLRTSL